MFLGTASVIFLIFATLGCSDSSSNQILTDSLTRAYQLAVPEELRYELTNDLGEPVGLGVFESNISSTNPLIIVLQERYSRQDNPDAGDIITTRVSGANFSALGGDRKVASVKQLEVKEVSYTWKISESDAERPMLQKTDNLNDSSSIRTKKLPNMPIYANSSSFWLWRQLPLEVGYSASYIAVDPFEEKWQLVNITVPQSEILKTPSGGVPVWRVLVRSGRATRSAWIEQSNPHRVLKWDNGLTVMTLVD